MKQRLEFIKNIYNKYLGKGASKKLNQRKGMTLADFKFVWDDYDIYDSYLLERDISQIFNYSMQTQADEIGLDKHL